MEHRLETNACLLSHSVSPMGLKADLAWTSPRTTVLGACLFRSFFAMDSTKLSCKIMMMSIDNNAKFLKLWVSKIFPNPYIIIDLTDTYDRCTLYIFRQKFLLFNWSVCFVNCFDNPILHKKVHIFL